MRGEKSKEGSSERKKFFNDLGCSDFGLDVFNQFYFSRTRRSLEHFFAQALVKEDNSTPTEKQINCFGNFAMIGAEANSSGSDWTCHTKLNHYRDSSNKIRKISVASLKFWIMMQICKDNLGKRNEGDEWNWSDIQQHQEAMMKFFGHGEKNL